MPSQEEAARAGDEPAVVVAAPVVAGPVVAGPAVIEPVVIGSDLVVKRGGHVVLDGLTFTIPGGRVTGLLGPSGWGGGGGGEARRLPRTR
jgi:hypothetical protein